LPFPYYSRLNARQRRIYDRSDAIGRVELPQPARLRPAVAAVASALRASDRRATEAAAAKLSAAMLASLQVAGVRVRVLAARPSHDRGELHGLYEPESGKSPLVTLWMRTAQRKQVVAFKTFLRTLLHELMHHLDYELFELEDSYHTQGFYKRESSLFRQLVPDPSRYEPRAAAGKTKAAVQPQPARQARRSRQRTRNAQQVQLPFAET
jgi:hypothetical protein